MTPIAVERIKSACYDNSYTTSMQDRCEDKKTLIKKKKKANDWNLN